MSVMPPFSDARPVCPKCQRPVDHTRFCAANRRGPIVPDCTVSGVGEHLHRMCQCGYFWVERCADATSTEPREREVERVAMGIGEARRSDEAAPNSQPAPVARGGAEELRTRPVEARPAGAPGGIAGGATDEEREDIVTLASDESVPASDPPAY
jgi:hypothetical protein